MRVIGIDPGTAITGYGIIDLEGNRLSVVAYDCITTQPTMSMPSRLQHLYRQLEMVLRHYRPRQFAVEELFFQKNVRTALAVGQARGVAILAAVNAGLAVAEYTPLQVKQAVVGYGRAAKEQVQYMVRALLGLPEVPRPDDVADALAVAICHAHYLQSAARIRGETRG
ncbi:Holliday junction endonuclease RuvC [Desulfofundulus australicus DSM 11792]|jgi:crossover junction endodeoxyribonuclease RuvC|uniref:Crossover junction endodeoxyribonuclease RuvC n=1 Tax=Desulfofundulus australicus DSM 11792 TaxID=1121425 RepID=A0A1M5AVS7_9FIRM|nr:MULTISPECIES: crossover junction endodeoxyribonuclease RuvC [Desulfofundulus]SHF34354.1 Holliday junction endonuclease RuvC [Desulfofundulus australicus DSM 11792]